MLNFLRSDPFLPNSALADMSAARAESRASLHLRVISESADEFVWMSSRGFRERRGEDRVREHSWKDSSRSLNSL